MNTMLKPFLHEFLFVFFDEILIYSSSVEDHVNHLSLVLQHLADNEFCLKLSKCHFGQPLIHYLDHIFNIIGVQPQVKKLEIINNWPQPQNQK